MPRLKKVARRGNHGAYRGDQRNESPFAQLQEAALPRRRLGGFTLQDEARNTERHQSFWNTDQRLRDTKVNFVSAGTLDSTKPKDAESALAEMSINDAEPNVAEDEDEAVAQIGNKAKDHVIVVEEEEDEKYGVKWNAERRVSDEDIESQEVGHTQDLQLSEQYEADFVVDTIGDLKTKTSLPPPHIRPVSPTASDSSEEVILFRGRDHNGRGISVAPPSKSKTANPIDTKIRIVEDKIHEQEELLERVLRHTEVSSSSTPQISAETSAVEFESLTPRHKARAHRRGPRTGKKSTGKSDLLEDEEALIADYLANMDDDDKSALTSFHKRDLGGSNNDFWQDTETSSGEPIQPSTQGLSQGGWDRFDICDFDDLSTSDGVMGIVQAVLSRRERDSGLQYLIVWEDQPVDEARWVPVTTLTSDNALLQLERFEAEEGLVAEFKAANGVDSSDSDDVGIDDDSADEDENEEEVPMHEKVASMSDTQLARLLTKQEELGMGSDELLLFDDVEDPNAGDEAPDTTNFPFAASSSKSKAAKGQGGKRPRGDFPSATLLADAYDGFDVMDFDRPSLKKKPKGQKGQLAFYNSDSEFEAIMGMTWENDRLKKKERKQEREELRAQGLLGNKGGKSDLKQKYKEGMGIEAVKDEIKNFLISGNTTLSLPPMDKADRKVVHELANAFNLKSKSAGAGNKRFPILYRTNRTLVFAEHKFNAVQSKLSRRFLPRMDVNGKRSGASNHRATRGGGFNSAGVSYRDGDIVGGSAPELGIENKGRAMLEKMGWSSGTALGALNNKGILQPVSHVVKTTKAGLG